MRSLILRSLCVCALVSLATTKARPFETPKTSCDSGYRVVFDDKGTIVEIAVRADITEKELKVILQRVADCRQDDPARDYLFSNNLQVWAFLEKGKQVSSAPAGKIVRFLPPGNVPQRKAVPAAKRREKDVYEISLIQARNSLRP
jgi:hypothetical protein